MMNNSIKNQAQRRKSYKQQTNDKRPFESLREVIGIVSAGAGIFAALLYLAGRSYAAGYFAGMNIPSYQVSFSMWEYGEVAWLPLLLYPVGMMAVTGTLMGIISRFFDLVSPAIKKFVTWLKTKSKVKIPTLNLPEASDETIFWFSLAKRATFILLLLGLIVFTLNFVRTFGQYNARLHITGLSASVEIISSTPLPLDENSLLPTPLSGQDYYVYKGLRLLTINDGHYYLFKEIERATCRPVKVYVIEARESVQVNLLPAVVPKTQCTKTALRYPDLMSASAPVH